MSALVSGDSSVRDILAAVTPGGGKSLLPVLAAASLINAGLIDRVCWIVPRDSLRLQAEEAFADPVWRATLDHTLSVRAADNTPDPSRGLAGYVTTYQGVAAAPGLHLAEFRRYRTLLVVDEVHHLPALAETDPVTARLSPDTDDDPASKWSQALQPLFECAAYRLLLSGTLERADGKAILWLPYRKGPRTRTREVEFDAPGWAVVGYSRRQALAERAVLPVTFGALDGQASWRDEEGRDVGPHRLAAAHPEETTRPALFTALRTGFAEPCCARPSSRSAASVPSAGVTAAWPPTRRAAAWASCWSSHQIKARPGAITLSCKAGCRPVKRRPLNSPRPTRRGRTRSSPPSGCGRSPRSWSPWRWPTRDWTRRKSQSSRR